MSALPGLVPGRFSRRLTPLRARWRADVEVARVQFRTVLVYRADFAVSLVVLLLQILALRLVWTSIYASRTSIVGAGGAGAISLSTQVAYVTLAAIQFWLFNSFANVYPLEQRIRDGRIAMDVARPVGLLDQVLSGQLGAKVAVLPFALLSVPFALLIGGAATPASALAAVAYVISIALAMALASLLSTILSMSAFWTMEISGLSLAYEVLARFLSGSLVPLWFMPGWLRTIAEVLPFQAIAYGPIAIYLGQTRGTGIWVALLVQAAWVLGLWAVLRLMWWRALRRIVVQGG